jgi:NADH-quinone oxidoreductase subunit M
VVGILYGGLVAWAQDDMKKLIAYSSVAHLGFVVLGLAAADAIAWDGALLQMVNHGLSTGALFLLVGMLYERRHTKKFDQFGGLAAVMPKYAFALAFAALASVGLPGLNGFVGEFLILAGSYRAGLILPTVLATAGVVVAAVYLFKMLHLTLWGPITHEENRGLADLSLREVVVLAPLCLLMLAIGLAPEKLLAASRPELTRVLATYEERSSAPAPERPALRPAGTERR